MLVVENNAPGANPSFCQIRRKTSRLFLATPPGRDRRLEIGDRGKDEELLLLANIGKHAGKIALWPGNVIISHPMKKALRPGHLSSLHHEAYTLAPGSAPVSRALAKCCRCSRGPEWPKVVVLLRAADLTLRVVLIVLLLVWLHVTPHVCEPTVGRSLHFTILTSPGTGNSNSPS